ncbi:hypothetical protein ACQ5SK_48155 [Bradyrhizobium japonicum]
MYLAEDFFVGQLLGDDRNVRPLNVRKTAHRALQSGADGHGAEK